MSEETCYFGPCRECGEYAVLYWGACQVCVVRRMGGYRWGTFSRTGNDARLDTADDLEAIAPDGDFVLYAVPVTEEGS